MQDGVLTIHCQLGDRSYDRTYDMPYVVDHITMDGDYMRILFADEDVWLQIKFEGDSGVIGDMFNNIDEDYCEPFACYDFRDDV